jgi:hypothetical protein
MHRMPWWAVLTLAASCGGTVQEAGEQVGAGGTAGSSDASVSDTGQGGTGGSTPDAAVCDGPNPSGCFSNGFGCLDGSVCSQAGCTSSHCVCDPTGWSCTSDCNGGTCVPVEGSAPKPCGGIAGLTCAPTEWCDYTYPEMNWCGGDDGSGVCQPRPTGCPADCPGTCGCDGTYYCNACQAHAAGTDDGAPCTGVDCDTAIQNIAAQIKDSACTAVVRVTYLSNSLLGYQLICGGLSSLDEAKARLVSEGDTGFGQNAQALAGPNPTDVFLFFEPPGDFGGVGVVSAHTGMSVFGG